MSITVANIASHLGISINEIIEIMDNNGIYVMDVNMPLSERQIKKIHDIIKAKKKNQNETKEEVYQNNEENVKDVNTNEEKIAYDNLEYYAKNYKVFIDTCSLLHDKCEVLFRNLCPLLLKYNNKLIIAKRVIDELNKHKNNTQKSELSNKANKALNYLGYIQQMGIIEIRGESTDNFADNVFNVVFTKFRINNKLMLITQDSGLAQDILNLNNSKSTKANNVYVKKINKYGFLSNFNFDSGNNKNDRGNVHSNNTKNSESYEEIDKFRLSRDITSISDDIMNVTNVPAEGSFVIASENRIELRKCLATGGEGSVFLTNTPYVAKIYKKEKITRRKYEKIKLMISKNVKCDGVCWPIDILYNSYNQFVGYLMPKALGKELQKCLFVKPLLLKNFPNWKRRDTVELCLSILSKIEYLHERNIILGDINPMNILVVNTKEIYFVDTDSYQIEEFPCPVGTVNYTAPEIQRKNFSSFLRSFGNEYFAVATLLFMIMLPGKPPYSQQGGENPADNIINMDFSYPFGTQSNKKTPDGPWRYIWSHMTFDIKKAFYTTFRKGEEHSTEQTRLTPAEWYSKLSYFLELLDNGTFEKQDPMSLELFPTRFKKISGKSYVKCKLCKQEVIEEQVNNGICRECLNKGETYRCDRCGKEIFLSNYTKYIRNGKKHETCHDCFQYLNSTYKIQVCADCGTSFEITNRENDYYKSKKFELPKRCSTCRKTKQNNIHYSNTYSSNNTFVHRQTSQKSSRKSKGCFITTAVCEYFGKPDDCYELTRLREFRDKWLINTSGGEELIKEYYKIAPRIVCNISLASDKDEIYSQLWNKYISICLEHIENMEYEECKNCYIDMVKSLNKYL